MTDGRGWRKAGMTGGREWPCSPDPGLAHLGGRSVFMDSQFVIPVDAVPAEGGIPRMPWLCEACHSRESGNLETFATGRLGVGRAALDSWSPMGVGDELRGMMEAQWIPAFAGMTGGRGWW